ncbi:MAG: FHA domain-containing protein [Acidobacteria bacterium]|nr:MAG: FHA domain-containing protein [Acidobacteriota bacterium]REK10681.1 MAG: FHA domain-containing protein [Acidobacteriota bacterium]
MTYSLRFDPGDGERSVPLTASELRIGRGGDNDIVLSDGSVSRQHLLLRWQGDALVAEDLGSTNGLKVNGKQRKQAVVAAGDELQIGKFVLLLEGAARGRGAGRSARASEGAAGPAGEGAGSTPATAGGATVPASTSGDAMAAFGGDGPIPAGTIVRKLSDLVQEDQQLDPLLGRRSGEDSRSDSSAGPPPAAEASVRGYLDALNRLARDLLRADNETTVLRTMLEVVFASLRVDRAFVLLGSTIDNLRCEILRDGSEVQIRPSEEVPVSQTILRTVMQDQVGLLSLDALDDRRLASGESIRLHGIRSAMCAPLWAEGEIVGFIQVDSPFQKGRFGGADLDFLITVANYGAVGIQRIQERRSRGRLERYHSPSVVEEVLRVDREEIGARGLRKAEVSVLFGDLVGFTAFSEHASMDEVADLLEGYFSRATEAVFAHGGTLDKFIGDCVMAFFGAPLDQEDHAERAVSAGLQLVAAVREWNEERRGAGRPEVAYRIGVNSGPVLVGDVGSQDRVDYTVLGNTVNLAQRLESGVAKPGDLVIGESTHRLLPPGFECEPLGEHALKGLQTRVRAFRVLGRGVEPGRTGGRRSPRRAAPGARG